MWSESEIRDASLAWRAVAEVYRENQGLEEVGEYAAGMAEGYASALEMILRESKA